MILSAMQKLIDKRAASPMVRFKYWKEIERFYLLVGVFLQLGKRRKIIRRPLYFLGPTSA